LLNEDANFVVRYQKCVLSCLRMISCFEIECASVLTSETLGF